jgi:tetratricopeptide (TPR) repeat protein
MAELRSLLQQTIGRTESMVRYSSFRKQAGNALCAILLCALLVILGASNTSTVFAQSNAAVLRVQGAQQSTYARVVVNIPTNVTYRVEYLDQAVRLYIDGLYRADFSVIEAANLQQIGNGRRSRAGGQTILTFDTVPNVSPRDFRSGDFVILDVYGGDPSASLPTRRAGIARALPVPSSNDTASGAQDGAEPDEGTAGQNEPAEANDTSSVEATSQDTSAQSTNNASTDELAEPIQEPTATSDDNSTAQPVDGVVLDDSDVVVDIGADIERTNSTLVLSGISDAVVDPSKVITTSVTDSEDGLGLRFSWPIETAAAVFQRGSYLWVVFDQPFSFSPQGLIEGGNKVTDRITRVSQRPHLDAVVLRMKLQGSHNVVVERDQNDWIVYLKDTPAEPRFPLKPNTNADGGQGQQIFIPADNIGRKVEFEDPDVGDQLVILPMLKQGTGLAEEYSYAAAQLLESSQGVVVLPETDFVSVERFRDGIAIRSTGNDELAASQLATAEDGDDGFSRLIDFERWRVGNRWEYRKNKALLFYELSLQSADDRNEVRWKIAKYYLAHGRAAEALGILETMANQDPLLEQNTDFLAVRGVANFKHGRLTEAETDLGSRELESEQDAELWRTLVAEAQGEYDDALEFYRRGRDVMGTYDTSDRAEIQLAVIRAAVETGDIELAQKELDLINALELTEAQLSESVFQRARIAEMQGQYDTAFAQYNDLSDDEQHWISARARYSRIRFAAANGDISADQAIDQLERLRFAWRGDQFEAQLLDDLAGYYFEIRDYELGLESLRQAISYHPEIAKDRRMLLRMQRVFKQLFLENRADHMPPISAIALFRKFRDLTPLGAEGDLMVRRLSQRLVSLDLLSQAAELLEYQVKVRTEGSARAQIAGNLAKIYIMDQKPAQAIEIIRATREPRLPNDVILERRMIEARALIEQARFEEAEVLIENDRSQDAETLRADVFWGAKDWPRLTSTIRRILGDGWRRNEALTALQRLNLVRLSIAMTFAEDRAGLIEMRRRYATQMRGGDFANAFDLLTNDQELSGRELSAIASQIASVEKLQSFMRDYRSDFSGR